MEFVIVGFGRIGIRTARTLQGEGHDVTVIERDPTKVERASEEGFDAIVGDGNNEDVLKEAGIAEADAVGALTGDLNTNFAVCVLGESHGCRTVLRINEDVSGDLYEKYAMEVDEIIYPERFGAAGAKTALLGGDFNVIADFGADLSVASVGVPEGSPAVGERVVDLDLPGEARIYAHGREAESMTIPLPQARVEPGDSLAIVANPNTLSEIRSMLDEDSAIA